MQSNIWLRHTQADLLVEHHEDRKDLAAMKGPANEVMQMTSRSCVGTGRGTGRCLCPWIGSSAEDCAEDK